MAARGWKGAATWREQADEIAPTIVGGSKKHGGPDLGPTRARAAWATLGVEGRTLAPEAPDPFHSGMPRLTVPMVDEGGIPLLGLGIGSTRLLIAGYKGKQQRNRRSS